MSSVPTLLRSSLALVLGLLWPSLGQFYSGRPRRAVAALLLTLVIVMPAAVEVPMVLSWSLPITLAGYLVGVGLLLLVPIDGAIVFAHRKPSVMSRWWVYVLYAIAVSLLLAVEMAWLPTYLPLRRFQIPSGAMIPTLLVGDVIVADMRPQATKSIDRGDLAVFENPDDPSRLSVKRVAGLSGDRVEVRGGVLLLNDEARTAPQADGDHPGLTEETLGRHRYRVRLVSQSFQNDFPPMLVPEGAIFVLGDNRYNSRDSRSFGFLPSEGVRGRAIAIHWSKETDGRRVRWDRIGMNLRSH